MSFTPAFTKLRFTTLTNGPAIETGDSSVGFTYAGSGSCNGADQNIGATQEGGIRCKVSGTVAMLGLSLTNGAQDQSGWDYGVYKNGDEWRLIIDGATMGSPNSMGQFLTATDDDEVQLRKVGDDSNAEVIAEILPAGGTWGVDELIIFRFAKKATGTLYPATQTYVGDEVMGPMILQIGQAQARVPSGEFKVIGEGDSLVAIPFLHLQNMAPFLGTGTEFVDLSEDGSTFQTMDGRVSAVNSAYDAGKSMLLLTSAATNDQSIYGRSSATIQSDAATWLSHVTGTYVGKVWQSNLPRAGAYSGQPAIDAGNAVLLAINADFASNLATIGYTYLSDRRRDGGKWSDSAFPAFTQPYFEAAPAWQEDWPNCIHPGEVGMYVEAQYLSLDLTALLAPEAPSFLAAWARGANTVIQS